MRTQHIFRPTLSDKLEDRVVMATSAGAVSGLALTDVIAVQDAVDSAFFEFGNEILTGFNNAAFFPDSPTTPNPVVGPALAAFQSGAADSVNNLAEQLSDLISPLRRSTRSLIPAMLAIVPGPGPGSLSNSINATIGRLTTAVNATQGPNTTPAENAAIQQANQDIQTLRAQLGDQIEAARVAVGRELNLFVNTPQGRAGGRPRLDLSAATNVVTPAYNTFAAGLASAIAAIPANPTSSGLPNNLNTLRAQVIGLTNTLSSQLTSAINSSLGGSGSTRTAARVRSMVSGLGTASLRDDLFSLIDQVENNGVPVAPGTFSLSTFNFGVANLVAQSRLTSAGILSVGSA